MLKFFRQLDWSILIPVLVSVFLGMMAILSTTWKEEHVVRYINKQVLALVIGLVLVYFLAKFNYHVFGSWAYYLYFFSLLTLILVLIFGTEIRGTRGWFNLGIFQFQPAEFAKLALLVMLAKYFSSIAGKPSRFQYIVVSGLMTLLPVGLILLQPDLGSAIMLVALWLCMLLVSGIKREHTLILIAVAAVVLFVGWSFALKPYQKARISSFLNPSADPLGSGYHLIQSKIAIGAGGILGRGLGRGTQSQLQFLPDEHTDFIFAVIAEELGLLGAGLVLALLGFLMWRIVRLASLIKEDFGLMLALGAAFLFSCQILINVGMNLGILPVTGVPLPFISYGGSALIMVLVIIGILENISILSRNEPGIFRE